MKYYRHCLRRFLENTYSTKIRYFVDKKNVLTLSA